MESLKIKSKDWAKFVDEAKISIQKDCLVYVPEENRRSHTPDNTEIFWEKFYHRDLPIITFNGDTFESALKSLCKYAAERIEKKAKGKPVYIDNIVGYMEKDPKKRQTFQGQPFVQFVLEVMFEVWEE